MIEEVKVQKAIDRAHQNAQNYWRAEEDISFHVMMLWMDNELIADGFENEEARNSHALR